MSAGQQAQYEFSEKPIAILNEAEPKVKAEFC